MGDRFFRWYCYNKDGSLNYERMSKFLGMTKSDLIFSRKTESFPLDKILHMSGVFVGVHPTSTSSIFYAPWQMRTCYHSEEDLRYIQKLISRRLGAEWETYEYFIMDSSGKIIDKNCDISQSIDENGVIRLDLNDGLEYFVYPAQRKKISYKHYFCYGSTLDGLNSHIKKLVQEKITLKPENFKNGFTKLDSTKQL